jgi:murein DD-endopeptidase MepM/ murein hydrolase activator NlpD
MRAAANAVVTALFILCSPLGEARADSIVSRVPGPFPDGMDTWLPANGSAVHDTSLRVGTLTGVEDFSLVRIDLSGLPQVATHAYLYLYAIPYAGTSAAPINVSKVTSQWHSGTVTAASQPQSMLQFQYPAPSPPGRYAVEITAVYNQWRSAASPNFGLRLSRASSTNNRFDMFDSSSSQTNRPQLAVSYVPQATDAIPKLKWPLSVPRSSLKVNLGFGGQSTLTCHDGKFKEHNGVDYNASHGTAVFAAEDGILRESIYDGSGPWAYNVVLEHNSPTGGKYTTVYWHVNPVAEISPANYGAFIPKGMQIATVADLGTRTHFHLGVRMGAYVPNLSGTGALPYATHVCDGYPAFPSGFVNPEPGPVPQLNVILQP